MPLGWRDIYSGQSHCYAGMQWLCEVMRRGNEKRKYRTDSVTLLAVRRRFYTAGLGIFWDFSTEPCACARVVCFFHNCVLCHSAPQFCFQNNFCSAFSNAVNKYMILIIYLDVRDVQQCKLFSIKYILL